MKERELVSIVMPIYRVERFIAQAIGSVLEQTYDHFELILVDDGSDDASMDIARSFDDPRIRVIRQANAGLAAARNTGIAASKGEFVALLDSDDYWHAQKLTRHVEHLQQEPMVGVSFAGSVLVTEDGEASGVAQRPQLTGITSATLLCRNPIGNGSAPVFRREVLEQTVSIRAGRKHYFDESLRQSEDVEYWVRIALTTDWIFEGIAGTWTYYRINQFGLSANVEKQFSAWKTACGSNEKLDPTFFSLWFNTAAAFQCRYLARRAVQSKDPWGALKMLSRGMFYDAGALVVDYRKTIGTIAGVFAVALLPEKAIAWLRGYAGQLGA
ncbi:MAG: glycosyltransferase family 2 protein [Pseudomonadota bacterium]